MSAAPLRRPHDVPTRPSVPSSSRASAARAVPARPAARPATEQRPRLRAVGAPEQARSLAPFAWTCVLIILTALGSVLLLNTAMAKGAYERRDLKIEIATLHQERSALISELEANSAPSLLAAAAEGLGMQRAEVGGVISLDDATVLDHEAGG